MSTAARNRCSGVRSFIVCFYCNESFRSLTTLLKHSCSAEEKISLGWESCDTVSDVNDVDLSKVDWDINDADLSQENWESHETVSDTNDCDLGQENSVSSLSESSVSNVYENSLPGTETNCETARQEITDLASDVSEKQLLETNVDVVREKVTKLTSDASEKQPLKAILGGIKEVPDLTTSDASEKQPLKAILGGIKEIPDLTTSDASEKQSLDTNSDVVKEVSDLTCDSSKKQLPVASSGTEQNITEVEPNTDDEFNRPFPDLVSKVLQYYEKQSTPTPDSCCKSPSTEMEFQSSSLPLSTVESSSPKHDNTQIECITTDVCTNVLSSDTACKIYGDDITQKESDGLKQDAKGLKSYDSNMCSRPSSPEVDSSDMFSRPSSVGMDLDDSLECGDDQAESNDSCISNTLSLAGKKSNEIKHDHVQVELHASKSNDKSLSKENLNITKHGSVILKPCYVKVHDIFKSLSNSKLSPKKICSWKKKYHVCDICYKFFRLRGDLNIHYLIHTSVKPYVCNLCGKSFIKQCNLFAHHFAHSIKRNHACSICKKVFPKRSLLIRHKLTHTREKPFACDKCDKSYTVKSSLTEHYLSHSDERPFICEICSASFNNKRYLRKHYYKHQRKENVCEFCFKTFKRKHHLDEHYNIHVNDRPNICKICGKSFHLLLTLNKHFAVAHRNERDLLFREKVKTFADCISGKDPVIQRVKKSATVDKAAKTAIKKTEKSAVTDKGEKTPVKKIEKSSLDDKSKETAPYSTRRKSLTPKKYLQPDTFILY